jgi:Fic family protein
VNAVVGDGARRDRLPYLIELALAHYQFETIHPFSDGNGRLGRALVNVAPTKDQWLRYPVCNLSEWVSRHREEYYDHLLRVSTRGLWEEWITFFCRALHDQAMLDGERADRLITLRTKYHKALTGRRSSTLVLKLVDHLFTSSAISIPGAAKIGDVSYVAAQRHVETLVKAGVLTQAGTGNYDKVYLARGIARAIAGREE